MSLLHNHRWLFDDVADFHLLLNDSGRLRMVHNGFYWCLYDSHRFRVLYDLLANLNHRLPNLNDLFFDLNDRLRRFDYFDCVVVLHNFDWRRLNDLLGDLHDRSGRFDELHDMVCFGDLALLN